MKCFITGHTGEIVDERKRWTRRRYVHENASYRDMPENLLIVTTDRWSLDRFRRDFRTRWNGCDVLFLYRLLVR